MIFLDFCFGFRLSQLKCTYDKNDRPLRALCVGKPAKSEVYQILVLPTVYGDTPSSVNSIRSKNILTSQINNRLRHKLLYPRLSYNQYVHIDSRSQSFRNQTSGIYMNQSKDAAAGFLIRWSF